MNQDLTDVPDVPDLSGAADVADVADLDNRVLVLDDDPGIRTLQRRALERAGYRVVAVETPEQAIAQIAQERPDVLLLDYRLGAATTGLDFYQRLRQDGVDVPAILVSGFSDESKIIEALRAGSARYRAQERGVPGLSPASGAARPGTDPR